MTTPTYWYRYEDRRFSVCDDPERELFSVRLEVHLWRFEVTRTTAKGVWLDQFGSPRFVLAGARKRWACPTEAEALESFIRRKQRQAHIHRAAAARADEAIALAEQNKVARIFPEVRG